MAPIPSPDVFKNVVDCTQKKHKKQESSPKIM